MAERVCEFEGCGKQARKRGLCNGHLWQQKQGKELTPIHRTFEDRFWSKVEKTETCWLWHGAVSHGGYGKVRLGRKMIRAHRAALNLEGIEIAPDMQVDHMCHNRCCVRPDHLRVVTASENTLNRETDPKTSSGYRGVSKAGSAWRGRIEVNGERISLGTYPTPELANEAVQKFVKENGIIWDTREILASDRAIAS